MFRGDSVSDTLAGVLKDQIDLSALPPETPAAIRGLLRHCLERSPKNRLRDIGDARLAIDEVLAGGGADAAGASMTAPQPSPSLGRLAPWALLLLVLGAGAGWLVGRAAAPPSTESKEFTLRRLTELPGLEGQPDLSPDGRQVVYSSAASGNLDIFVMRSDGGRAINITADSAADDEQAAFSPNGERLVFRSSRDGGGLFLMGATGESVRRLTDGGFDPAWSPDGAQVAYSVEPVLDPYARDRTAALWIVNVATGEKRQRLPGDAVQPAWSPDGRRIAYWANTAGQRDLWTVGAESGEPVAVTADEATDWSPEWSPDGRWLYFSSDRAGSMNLFRVAIDPATGGASGAPEQMTTSVGNLGWFRFSADGRRLVAAAYERSAELHLYNLSQGTAPELQPLRRLRPRFLHWCKFSPDAEWLACATIGTPEDVVLLRADGSELRRLTDDAFKDRNISWSRDGSRLVFDSTRSSGWDLWTVRADGSELRRVAETSDSAGAVWSSDGKRLTFVIPESGLAEVDSAGFTAREAIRFTPLPDSMQGFEPGEWSPSGEFLGGTEVDSSRRALSIGALVPKSRTYRRSQLPIADATWLDAYWKFAGWLPDSRHYVAAGRDQIALVDVETGAWRGLQAVDKRRLLVSLSRDGRTLLVEQEVVDGDLWMLEIAGAAK